jgi:hypothetical protein
LNEGPKIALFDEVLNVIDCAYLIYVSRPHMKRADVVAPDSQSGDPVWEGEKWVVTKWFRERPTHYLEN